MIAFRRPVKRIPSIAGAMTPFPYSIASDASVPAAIEMMKTHGINHLPVMRGTDLIGLLWNRDVRVAQALSAANHTLTVEQLCSPEPYIVELSERLDLVVLRDGGTSSRGRHGHPAGQARRHPHHDRCLPTARRDPPRRGRVARRRR